MTTAGAENDVPLELHTLHHEGRDIAYSTSPRNKGQPPVMFFYPVGAGRRMLLSFRSLFSELYFICVNRPGKGGTSSADKNGAASHLAMAVQDAIAVLDTLGIEKVSLLCMCAGTPFGMAFAAQHAERTTGRFLGISTWVQPADCGYENTKLMYYIGTQEPRFTGPMTGTLMSSLGFCFSSVPLSWFAQMIQKKLSPEERKVFQEHYKNMDDFCNVIRWMQQDPRGGLNEDLKVLLSAGVVDYKALSENQESIVLWHGTNDTMVPFVGAKWMEEQLPGATLAAIPGGTHEGCMFLLHQCIVDSIKSLGRMEDVDTTAGASNLED